MNNCKLESGESDNCDFAAKDLLSIRQTFFNLTDRMYIIFSWYFITENETIYQQIRKPTNDIHVWQCDNEIGLGYFMVYNILLI